MFYAMIVIFTTHSIVLAYILSKGTQPGQDWGNDILNIPEQRTIQLGKGGGVEADVEVEVVDVKADPYMSGVSC